MDEKAVHDFKNQLAIIGGFSEVLLAEAEPDDPRRGDFEDIQKAAMKALDLLCDWNVSVIFVATRLLRRPRSNPEAIGRCALSSAAP